MNDMLSVWESEVWEWFEALRQQGLISKACKNIADLLSQEHPEWAIKTDRLLIYPGKNDFVFLQDDNWDFSLLPSKLIWECDLCGVQARYLEGVVNITCEGSNITFLFSNPNLKWLLKKFLLEELQWKGNYRIHLPWDAFVIYKH